MSQRQDCGCERPVAYRDAEGPAIAISSERGRRASARLCAGATSVLLLALACSEACALEPAIEPAKLARVAMVDARFQSYNIEMVEVTGGRFWRPYSTPRRSAAPARNDPDLYADRPPIDLSDARLRRLAAALAPAYLRVSGTWANATYFAEVDPAPSPPVGFNSVLTRTQWRGVVEFSRAVNAPIVTSFAISPGTRDATGRWRPDQASRLLGYTRELGGRIAAAEFMNEPDLAAFRGGPKQEEYEAGAFGRDFKLFYDFFRQADPGMLILGPGTVGDTIKVPELLAASGRSVDVFSYHYYGMVSERCGGVGTPRAALSEDRLAGTDKNLAFNRSLRDRFEPGKPIWLTETAEAACGGNRWASKFADSFRYLDQLGRLAKAGVQVVMHNTLAASDYGLLDETTLRPRPNYWGALLWRRLMGTTVLDAALPLKAGLHVYAHCQRGVNGGVSLLVINNDTDAPHDLSIASATRRYTLDASSLEDSTVRLNGAALALTDTGDLPPLEGIATTAGVMTFAPVTITFLAVPTAANQACLS